MTMTTTPWGYMADMEKADIVTAENVYVLTGSSPSARTEPLVAAVTQVVRDYCGWHVTPVLDCEYRCDGSGGVIALPAMFVESVQQVAINGEPIGDDEWHLVAGGRGGILRVNRKCGGWDEVTVTYRAGYEGLDAIRQAVANAVASALVTPNGVREEHAGTVGLTYSNAGDASFVPTQRLLSVLDPYRLVRGL